MYLYIRGPRRLSGDTLEGTDLRAYRKALRLSISEMSERLGLYHRSSLLQYETGAKPLSQRVKRRFLELTELTLFDATVFSSALTDRRIGTGCVIEGRVAECACGCGRVFLAQNKRRFYARSCQLRIWRVTRDRS